MGAAFLYGNGGSVVKSVSGSFTTDLRGGATVELGFKPDVVALTGYTLDRDSEFQLAFVFPAKTTSYHSKAVCSDTSYPVLAATIQQTETGFTISGFLGFTSDWSSTTLTRKRCNYVAIKYT